MFSHLPLETVIAYFQKRISEEERRIRAERKKSGKQKFLGMEACFKQSAFSTPETSVPMYARNPRFSATTVEAVKLAVEAMRTFWRQYKIRLEGFRKGSVAKFPSGTILMQMLGAKCAELGSADPHCPRYAPFQLE